jgi:hypothetical protein
MDGGCPRTNPRSSAEDDQASGPPGAVQQRWSAWTALMQDTRGSTQMRPPAHLRSAALPASLPCNTADGSHPRRLLASPSRRPAGGGPIHKAETGRPSAACGREREALLVPAPADGPPLGRECTSGDPLRWRPGRRRCSHAIAQARGSARSDQEQKASLGVHRRNPVVADTDRREPIWAIAKADRMRVAAC